MRRYETGSNGYKITSVANGKAIGTKNNNKSLGADVTSYGNATSCCEWIFEPAYSGNATYFVVANDIGSEGNGHITNSLSYLRESGYNTSRVDLPSTGFVREVMPSNRLTIIHGHGSTGHVILTQPNTSSQRLYSTNPSSDGIALNFNLRRNSIVIFLSCKSATPGNGRISMVSAARGQGATCVIGFRNNVANGEKFVKLMMLYAAKFPTQDMREIIKMARTCYSDEEKLKENSPANENNIYCSGYAVAGYLK